MFEHQRDKSRNIVDPYDYDDAKYDAWEIATLKGQDARLKRSGAIITEEDTVLPSIETKASTLTRDLLKHTTISQDQTSASQFG